MYDDEDDDYKNVDQQMWDDYDYHQQTGQLTDYFGDDEPFDHEPFIADDIPNDEKDFFADDELNDLLDIDDLLDDEDYIADDELDDLDYPADNIPDEYFSDQGCVDDYSYEGVITLDTTTDVLLHSGMGLLQAATIYFLMNNAVTNVGEILSLNLADLRTRHNLTPAIAGDLRTFQQKFKHLLNR